VGTYLSLLVLIYFLDGGLLSLLDLLLVVGHLLLGLLGLPEGDGVLDELGMLLDQVLDLLLLKVLELVVLEVQDDLGPAAELLTGVAADEELTTSAGFPNVSA
jgi:hypothetical protein